MQTAEFVELLAVPQAQAKNPLFDIIIEGKVNTQNYCNVRHIATLYWTDCCKTYKPCWEVIVDKVKVVSIIISSEEERKSMQKELFSNNCNFNIEKLTLFINEINKT